MKHATRILCVVLLACFWSINARAQFSLISITSPVAGQVVQGAVPVIGTSSAPDFAWAAVSFAYSVDDTETWFLIAQTNQSIESGTLAIWDTTLITDGDYTLRLHVSLMDGTTRDSTVSNLRVRNYTPVETVSPAPILGDGSPTPSAAQTATPYPTPTSLPSNSAELTQADVWSSIAYGGLAAILLIVIVGIYLWFQRK